MGKYSPSIRKDTRKPERPHPVWRGIGCLIMIIIPVISYAASAVVMPLLYDRGLVPYQLTGTPQVPDWLWYVPVLAQFIQGIIGRPAFFATLLLTILFIIILGGIFSVGYATLYKFVGPPRYGPMDAPPVKKKVKKYTR